MKALVCALVLMLVCSTTVHSLQCFTCVGDDCKVRTECPPSANFCRTEATAHSLSRTCEESCTPAENIHCCNHDLCG
ncbi:hypothetical protein G5714_003595 [Onychostoma macrolepis]|uniref:Snake toxin/toxin-like domain-containing protein n=1 Tax=Onychostoma macrolepis TaxID=369639 RepID=A0A7J6D9X3_9TELE|nr:hypothetical protein G5714_003595 [Onychostoma macrolepis]